jgi:imidazolonepropionase-like amidohydrolase
LLWTSYEQVRTGFPAFAGEDLNLARQGFKRMQAFVRRFHAAGGTLLAGTDMSPWPGAGLHEELRLLVESGLSPLAALQAATWNPARALGWDGRTGTVAVGLDADLVLLDANPLDDITNTTRIWAVVRAGQVLDRTTLDRLLAVGDTARGR